MADVPCIAEAATPADILHIKECVESSKFDTLGLQRALYDGLTDGSVELRVFNYVGYGRILILYEVDYPWAFPFKDVGRVLQLFHDPSKLARVVFFGNRTERRAPAVGYAVEKEHINGGYAMPCKPNSIVVYRREEVLRVLIHEFYHASCSDPVGGSGTDPSTIGVEHVEADTEAWAELALCALGARGKPGVFKSLFKAQMDYAVGQCDRLASMYGVHGPEDYAWRYTIGKLDVWRRLGFVLPKVKRSVREPLESLRLTLALADEQ